jgi:hypothetical protein
LIKISAGFYDRKGKIIKRADARLSSPKRKLAGECLSAYWLFRVGVSE